MNILGGMLTMGFLGGLIAGGPGLLIGVPLGIYLGIKRDESDRRARRG